MKKVLATVLALVMALGLCSVSWADCTAEGCEHKAAIGTTHYDTLAAAVTAAQPGDTIMLIGNETGVDTIVVTKDIHIEFGAYTVTGKPGAQVLCVTNAKVTLNGTTGGINGGSGGDNVAVVAAENGEVTINGGIYTVGGDAKGLGNSTVYANGTGATVIINGGTFSSEKAYNGKYYVLNQNNNAPGGIKVNGGNFVNYNPCKGDDANGGNFAPNAVVASTGTEENVKYHVGNDFIVEAAKETKDITVVQGTSISGLPNDTKVTNGTDSAITVNGNTVTAGTSYTVPARYYYHPSTTTTPDTTKGSPKTFDAGVGIYAVTAVLSVTGMAWTAKKRH